MASPLAVTFTADLSGLSRGMQDAARIAEQGGGAINAGFLNFQRGAQQATDAVSAFTREQRSQARVVNFLAGEFGHLTNATKGTLEVMRGLGGLAMDFAEGSVIGVAVGALGLLVAAWKAVGDAGDTALKKSKEELRDLATSARQAETEYERLAYIRAGGDGRMFDAIQKTKSGEEYYQDLLRRRGNLISDLNKDGPDKLSHAAIGETKMELRDVNKRIAEIESQRKIITLSAQAQIDADIEKEREKAGAKHAKAYIDGFSKVMEANAKERVAWSLQQYGGYGTDADQARLRAERLASEKSELDANLTMYAGGAADRGMKGAATSQGMSRGGIDKAIDEHAKRVKAAETAYKKLGDIGSQALGDLISGHKKVGDVVKEAGAKALGVMAKYALTEILNNSWVAFSKTTAETGGPWGLGLGAMVQAAVAALAGNVVSAEGGGDMLGMRGPFSRGGGLAVWHPNEITIPAEESGWIRKAAKRDAEGFGEARSSATLRVLGKNGSFYDVAVAGGRDLARAIKTLQRQGVL